MILSTYIFSYLHDHYDQLLLNFTHLFDQLHSHRVHHIIVHCPLHDHLYLKPLHDPLYVNLIHCVVIYVNILIYCRMHYPLHLMISVAFLLLSTKTICICTYLLRDQ
jgi:hypothetical protein